jgi:hypothetical protein
MPLAREIPFFLASGRPQTSIAPKAVPEDEDEPVRSESLYGRVDDGSRVPQVWWEVLPAEDFEGNVEFSTECADGLVLASNVTDRFALSSAVAR